MSLNNVITNEVHERFPTGYIDLHVTEPKLLVELGHYRHNFYIDYNPEADAKRNVPQGLQRVKSTIANSTEFTPYTLKHEFVNNTTKELVAYDKNGIRSYIKSVESPGIAVGVYVVYTLEVNRSFVQEFKALLEDMQDVIKDSRGYTVLALFGHEFTRWYNNRGYGADTIPDFKAELTLAIDLEELAKNRYVYIPSTATVIGYKNSINFNPKNLSQALSDKLDIKFVYNPCEINGKHCLDFNATGVYRVHPNAHQSKWYYYLGEEIKETQTMVEQNGRDGILIIEHHLRSGIESSTSVETFIPIEEAESKGFYPNKDLLKATVKDQVNLKVLDLQTREKIAEYNYRASENKLAILEKEFEISFYEATAKVETTKLQLKTIFQECELQNKKFRNKTLEYDNQFKMMIRQEMLNNHKFNTEYALLSEKTKLERLKAFNEAQGNYAKTRMLILENKYNNESFNKKIAIEHLKDTLDYESTKRKFIADTSKYYQDLNKYKLDFTKIQLDMHKSNIEAKRAMELSNINSGVSFAKIASELVSIGKKLIL